MLGVGDRAGDLWAKAAELERQFEGYKRLLAERRAAAVAADDRPGVDGGGAGEEEDGKEVAVGRGRRYEAYVRRRDEKLRQGWRARMERKEAEMKAFWACLDRGRRADADGGLTASPAREQKPLNFEVKTISPVTPRCSSAMKLARPRSSMSLSPATAASPRLSNRRALHREPPQAEPPTTPRKENRMPTPSTAAATPRLKKLSRSRSLLKDKERGCSSVRESPRPPRLQPPRASYDSAADLKGAPVLAPSADAIALTRSCLDEQVVLAEIKMAAAVASEPSHLRRSGNGVAHTSPPLVTPRQVDGCTRLDNIGNDSNVGSSEYSDVEAKNFNINEGNNDDDEIPQSSGKLGDVEITNDSDTEPSYVYIKKDNEDEAVKSSQALVGSGSDAEPTPEGEKETENFEDTMASSDTIVRESPVIDAEAASRESSESLYSNVQSSFSHRSDLDASATDSPPHSPPSSSALSTKQLLEADAARLRKKREEDADGEKSMLTPSIPRNSVSVAVQTPMDAVAGLKRFLTFGKKNSKGTEAAVVVKRTPPSVVTLVGDDSVSEGWLSGDSISIKPRMRSFIAASDNIDNSYVISPHVRSLQSFVPSSPAISEPKEIAPPAKSPRVHRSFFSFSSFKSRGN